MKGQMRSRSPLKAFISFFTSVKMRLTMLYVGIFTLVLMAFGGSLYGAESRLVERANDAELETSLYRNTQLLTTAYEQALDRGLPPASQHIALSSGELLLLLRSDGTIQEKRGPLNESIIQQLRASMQQSQKTVNMNLPVPGVYAPEGEDGSNYRVLITPIIYGDAQMTLFLGLPREKSHVHQVVFWLAHGVGVLIVGTLGGYWLASKALRPVQMITRMANEINATDLRRRLRLKQRDEFGQLAATFDQMLARLEASFKRQTQFAADASHELRTPLTIIGLETNRALTQSLTPEEYRQILELIRSENEHMTYIVNNLLTLARADTGQITLHLENVDLGDLALASVERLLSLARQNNIALSTGELPELIVRGDPQYINRMLMNLIENAIKYTADVGQRVHVDLSQQDRWGVIRVEDDGPGIAEEHIPSLFERFYRVDKVRNRRPREQTDVDEDKQEPGGTGLGLSIVQWIVQAHGGEVRVESKVGSGSVFEVRLPLLEQEKEVQKKQVEKKSSKCQAIK